MPEPLLSSDTMKRLEQLMLVSRRLSTARRKGERRSRRRGASADFADYRNYAAGDDLRFLDWKIYGRLERLFIKLFLDEEDLRVSVLLDASPSMAFGDPDKLLYAKRVAAALGHVCLARQDSLSAMTFGDGILQSFGPRRGRFNSARYFDFLSSVQPAGRTALEKSFRAFAMGTGARGLAIVISDFYDFAGYEPAFRQLFGGNFEVLAIHVLSPQELAPDFKGDIRLVDAEAGYTADVSMGKGILDMYNRALSAFSTGMKNHIVSRGGHYLLTSTRTPFELLVLDVLRRKGVVR